jgi:hypothetical protein
VVVDRSYRSVRKYGVLQCFVLHHYKVYATHVVGLPGGGTASLISLRIDKRDVATANWLQPVRLGAMRAWRRVVLYEYVEDARPPPSLRGAGGIRGFGIWLINTLSPYGGTRPPARFKPAERELTRLAGLVTGNAA